MKRTLLAVGLLLPLGATGSIADEPDAKGEKWIRVMTRQGSWAIRVDGTPEKQVEWRPPEDKRWKFVPGAGARGDGISGWLSLDGKRVLFHEDDPNAKDKQKTELTASRLMLVDVDGKNQKQVLTGLSWFTLYIHLCPDGKALVVGAEEKGKWYPFRIDFDGMLTKLSETSGIAPPVILPLSGDRYLYHPFTDKETVKSGPFSSVVTRGPVILLDGKKETVLLKETTGTPAITMDATRMAQSGKNNKGEEVISITDLKTGKKEEFPMSAFNKDWKCRFGWLKFSPDGQALAMKFFPGAGVGNVGVVIRDKGPQPGDEAVEHFGVIWLDGRKERTALFRVDQPRDKRGDFFRIEDFEWMTAPPAKK